MPHTKAPVASHKPRESIERIEFTGECNSNRIARYNRLIRKKPLESNHFESGGVIGPVPCNFDRLDRYPTPLPSLPTGIDDPM